MSTEPRRGVVVRVIALCAHNPWTTIVCVAALAAWGYYSLRHISLDAIPDLSDAQVVVFTEWPGRSPDLVEAQITYPISSALRGAPAVKFVRGQSFFGLSFVYAIFEDGTDLYWARSRVSEYLSAARKRLPAGVEPSLGPDATGVGWVFQYALVDRSGHHDLQELRTLQDWNVRYALSSVHGVAEVASIGGFVKAYQVQVDPNRLLSYGISVRDVMMAVRASNVDVGGHVIEIAGHEHMIRGRGYLRSVADLENVPLMVGKLGTPVLLRDVATVSLGPDMRRGIAELDGQGEVTGGIVIMRYGENALDVIRGVRERLQEVRASLPKGVELVVTYDRSHLIVESIDTLKHTLREEMIVVSLVIFLFLLHVRSALIPILSLPIAVLLAFIPMLHQHLTANIMSLGGIAVAIGAMVDASIILIENIHNKLGSQPPELEPKARFQLLVEAMQEVGPSIFFSLLVITASFLPVFTLEATEGRLFRPLAFTKSYSMGFSAVLAVTLTPALAALFIRGRIYDEHHHPVNRVLLALYAPVVRFVVQYRRTVIVLAVLVVVLTVPVYFRLGHEFMPPLNEGVVLYMPTAPPGISGAEASRVLQDMDARLAKIPEVQSVFGKMGRAETATDPAPLSMAETVVVLKPRSAWRHGLQWQDLIREMDRKLHYPGMPNVFWMPIQTRTEMLSTGIRAPLGVQVIGDDLDTLEGAAVDVEHALSHLKTTRSAFAERATGGLFIDFSVRREAAARLGLSVEDISDVISTAIGGMTVTETVEGRQRYPVSVRYARDYRRDPDDLGRVLVATPKGTQVPLSQVADLSFVNGPDMIRSEDGKLVSFVIVDTDQPLADYVTQAKQIVAREVTLPPGVRLEWTGQFRYFERAKQRLQLVIPITLALVMLLLYLNTKSWVETAIVMMAVPFSLVGAFWLLYLLHYNLSVAVWVGLIALAGLDAETGVVMLLYLTLAHQRAHGDGRARSLTELKETIVEGSARRIRPKLMTVLTMLLGLLPVLHSQGAGADVMQRIAAPMVGGLVTSFLLELTIYPAVFALWKGRGLPYSHEPAPEPQPQQSPS